MPTLQGALIDTGMTSCSHHLALFHGSAVASSCSGCHAPPPESNAACAGRKGGKGYQIRIENRRPMAAAIHVLQTAVSLLTPCRAAMRQAATPLALTFQLHPREG